ncbi:MAG: TIM barrel protein [Planctomycetes bacterium]|nr:TIM barrel protein [Planctomycetota bacterium]
MTNLCSRRDLLKWSAAAGAAAIAAPKSLLSQDKKRIPIGLQLYSVKNALGKDFEGTLKQVAEMGIEGVEFAGVFGKYGSDPEGLRKLLDGLKLQACGTHTGAGNLTGDKLKKTVEFYKALGCKFLIVPGDGRYTKPEPSKEYAEFMTKLAETLKADGMMTGHHNHTGEFAKAEGDKTYFDLFAERTPKEVVIQQDMGHTMAAGVDPIAIVRKHPGRIKTTHIKNRPAKASGKKPYVGEDNFDWKGYITACYEVGGTEWFTLE